MSLATIGGVSTLALIAGCVSAPFDPRHRALHQQPPPSVLPVPVLGVATSQLRDSFGDPRSGGRRHEGIDIFAARHTPVMSATDGIVARVGTNAMGGLVVWVTGPAGWRHYYAHLEAWGDIREGQWLEAGDIIGYVGSSGNAAGGAPHLHYGIFRDGGGAENPYPLLIAGLGPAVARVPTGSRPPPATAGRLPPQIDAEARSRAEGVGIRVLRELLGRAVGGR